MTAHTKTQNILRTEREITDASCLDQLLARFEPVSLRDLDDVTLQDRVDTKMLLTFNQLCSALHQLTDHYHVLKIDGRRMHRYQTLYFDTPDLGFYHQHHNGKRNRYKVRERAYVDSGLAFVEVKHKTRPNHTVKHRRQVTDRVADIRGEDSAFVRAHTEGSHQPLLPVLWNTFQRVTLASVSRRERVTVDYGMHTGRDGDWVALPGVVVAEVKQPRFSYDSDFLREMRHLGVRPGGFSKYCTGISLLYPEVKHNNFKPRLLQLDHLMQTG